ncbi:MAG: TVP38/TMEM64 family protein [Acidobacteria bacterium]|nr:TVP38/TMEM64 family protein [Acidobacteriota bacterium]
MFDRIVKHIRELGHLTPMALVSMFLPMIGSAALIIFIVPIGNWLQENWQIGTLFFIAGTIFFCGLALLPTNVIGVVSGWAFGFWLGAPVLLTGIVGSAFISFLINSRISGKRLPEVAEKYPRTSAIYNALLQDNFWKTTLIIFLLRVSVVTPFAFTNFFLASAKVPIGAFLLGTGGGMLPRSAAMVYVGSGLSVLDIKNTTEVTTIVISIAATVLSVIVIAYLSRKALDKVTLNAAVPEN